MDRTTAYGLWRFAEEYLNAAEIIDKSANTEMELSAPKYYLIGHSIELVLKAFLLAKGVSLKDLRNMKLFGHNLEAALIHAESLGSQSLLEMSEEERASIVLLNVTYKSKEHEYITTGYVVWPNISILLPLLKKLLAAFRAVCVESTLNKNAIK